MKGTCPWATKPGIMKDYHDTEWGVPVFDDKKMFEFILLESAQAGLSWQTILNKRENYRVAFSEFNPEKIALYTKGDVAVLLNNSGIIRNKKKIKAAIGNACAFLETASIFGSFSDYIWQFTDGKPINNNYSRIEDVPAKTELSTRISKDMKSRGFTFFGPVICYSHMQAAGMMNDHMNYCHRYLEVFPVS